MRDKKQATIDKPSDSLKPCPFCGGEAVFYRTPVKTNSGWCDSVVVKCKECEARTGRILYDARKHPNDEEYDEAAALWNTRKPVDAVLDRLEEVKTKRFVSGITASPYEFGACHAVDTVIEIIKENLT